ncbi:MAG: hypothetical protein NVS2B6_06310 [Thermoleophilaceae bacterium]
MVAVGLVVIVIGLVMLAVEAHAAGAGIVGGAGALALVAGAVLALSAVGAGLAVVIALGIVAALLAAGALALVGGRVRAVRRLRVAGGCSAGLVGRLGVVRSWAGESGRIALDGALWRAHDDLGEDRESLHAGDRVVVNRVTGLTLRVRKAEDWEVLQ